MVVSSSQTFPERRSCLFIVIAVVLLFGLVVASLIGRILEATRTPEPVAQELQNRLAHDYPGWTVFMVIPGAHELHVVLVPPGYGFHVAVEYVFGDDAPLEARDAVFCVSGELYAQAGSLLDLIQNTYVSQGDAGCTVLTDSSGRVTISWIRAGSTPFSSESGMDVLEYDPDAGAWHFVEDLGP